MWPVVCNLESGYTIARGAGANGGAKIAHTCRHAGAENVGFVERIGDRVDECRLVAAVGSSRDRDRTRPDRGPWYLPLSSSLNCSPFVTVDSKGRIPPN